MMRYDREAILDAWTSGRPSHEIARELGIKSGAAVRTVVRRARKTGDRRAIFRLPEQVRAASSDATRRRAPSSILLHLEGDDGEKLADAAFDLGISPTALCRKLVFYAIRDGMVSAILDEDA